MVLWVSSIYLVICIWLFVVSSLLLSAEVLADRFSVSGAVSSILLFLWCAVGGHRLKVYMDDSVWGRVNMDLGFLHFTVF